MRVFGYFLHEQKVTRGPGLKAPQGFGKKYVSFPPARRNANQPCIGQLRWYKKIKSPLPAEPACEKGKEALE